MVQNFEHYCVVKAVIRMEPEIISWAMVGSSAMLAPEFVAIPWILREVNIPEFHRLEKLLKLY